MVDQYFGDLVMNGRYMSLIFHFRFSKQNFLSEVTNPFSLPDHTASFKEYTGSKNNRFLSPAQASKNRIQPPSKVQQNLDNYELWINKYFTFFIF